VEETHKKRKKIAERIWIGVSFSIILFGISVDLAISFIAAIIFMVLTYLTSGIAHYEWHPEDNDRGENKDDVDNYNDKRNDEEYEISWIMIISGLLPLAIDFILLVIGYHAPY